MVRISGRVRTVASDERAPLAIPARLPLGSVRAALNPASVIANNRNDEKGASDQDGQVQPDRRQTNSDDDSDEARHLSDLRCSKEEPACRDFADFIGYPRIFGAIRERRADSPDDLGDKDRRELRDRALEDEPGANEAAHRGHGPAAAESVGEEPGRDLEDEARELEDAPHQEQA